MKPLEIQLMADSASEISAEHAEQYRIEMIPMIVTEGDREYLDGVNFNSDDLLQGMSQGKMYKTAQIPLNTYLERFQKHAETGRSLICFVLSSGLTGSYETAQMARNMILEDHPEADITVIDSKCASQGYGLLVLEVARYLAHCTPSKQELLDYISYLQQHVVHLFTVEDMEFLYRGGRVSRVQAIIGGMLGIKPMLDVSPEGKLRPFGKARGTKNLIKGPTDEARKRIGTLDISKQTVYISSGLDTTVQEAVRAFFESEYHVTDFIIQKIGATVGAHTGPYMCAFFFLDAAPKR